jgi:hypothetical protein
MAGDPREQDRNMTASVLERPSLRSWPPWLLAALLTIEPELEQVMERVARDTREVPSEVFQTLWRDSLTGCYETGADPRQQAAAFRAERRTVSAEAKLLA